jgi:hypothetical protein
MAATAHHLHHHVDKAHLTSYTATQRISTSKMAGSRTVAVALVAFLHLILSCYAQTDATLAIVRGTGVPLPANGSLAYVAAITERPRSVNRDIQRARFSFLPTPSVGCGSGYIEEGISSSAWVETLHGRVPIWTVRVGDWISVHDDIVDGEFAEDADSYERLWEQEEHKQWESIISRVPPTCLFQPVTSHAAIWHTHTVQLSRDDSTRGNREHGELCIGRNQRLVFGNSTAWRTAKQLGLSAKEELNCSVPAFALLHVLTVHLAHNYHISWTAGEHPADHLLVHNGGVASRIGALWHGEGPTHDRAISATLAAALDIPAGQPGHYSSWRAAADGEGARRMFAGAGGGYHEWVPVAVAAKVLDNWKIAVTSANLQCFLNSWTTPTTGLMFAPIRSGTDMAPGLHHASQASNRAHVEINSLMLSSSSPDQARTTLQQWAQGYSQPMQVTGAQLSGLDASVAAKIQALNGKNTSWRTMNGLGAVPSMRNCFT